MKIIYDGNITYGELKTLYDGSVNGLTSGEYSIGFPITFPAVFTI